MAALKFFFLVISIHLTATSGHVITPAPRLPFHDIDPADAPELFGRMPNGWLGRRQAIASTIRCDGGEGYFVCATGTCYTGLDGFIGCCSVSSCRARTTCIDYNPTSTRENCDINTGGCIQCSNTERPYCVKITNIQENQYIMYCGATATTETISYENRLAHPERYPDETWPGSTDTVGPEPVTAPPSSRRVATSTVEIRVTVPPPTSTLQDDPINSSAPEAIESVLETPGNTVTDSTMSLGSLGSSTSSDGMTTGGGLSIDISTGISLSSLSAPTRTSGSPSASSDDSDEGPSLSAGAVTGIAVAGAAGLAFAVLSAWYFLFYKRGGRKSSQDSSSDEKSTPVCTPLVPGSNGSEGGPSELESSELKQGPWSPSSLNRHPASPELDSTPIHSQQVSPMVAQDQFTQPSGSAQPLPNTDSLHPPSLTPAIKVQHASVPSHAELPAEPSPRTTQALDFPPPPRSNNFSKPLRHPHSSASMINNATYNPNNFKTTNLIPYSFDDSEMSPRSAGPTYMTAEEAMGGGGTGFWERERSNSPRSNEAERPAGDAIVVEPLHVKRAGD